jgi:hypothetical protein
MATGYPVCYDDSGIGRARVRYGAQSAGLLRHLHELRVVFGPHRAPEMLAAGAKETYSTAITAAVRKLLLAP